jgi:malate dehydrogenase (oxaloacetate-decarboxylating)(NADP+)
MATSSTPQPTGEQNLLRLQKHLAALPTSLLKHMHLSKTRREDPRLFFQAMNADLVNL